MDISTMITTYNTAVTDTTSEIFGRNVAGKKPWVSRYVLDVCDVIKDLKEKPYKAERAKV